MSEKPPKSYNLYPGTANNGRFRDELVLDSDFPGREGAARYVQLKDILIQFGVRTEIGEVPQEIRSLALRSCLALKNMTSEDSKLAKEQLLRSLQHVDVNIKREDRTKFKNKTDPEIRAELIQEVKEFFHHE